MQPLSNLWICAREMDLATMIGDRTIPSAIAVEDRYDSMTTALHWLTAALVHHCVLRDGLPRRMSAARAGR
jgi:hypothetical protein